MKKKGYGLVFTELWDSVQQLIPVQKSAMSISEIWDDLWETDMSAQELAEKYPMYE